MTSPRVDPQVPSDGPTMFATDPSDGRSAEVDMTSPRVDPQVHPVVLRRWSLECRIRERRSHPQVNPQGHPMDLLWSTSQMSNFGCIAKDD